MHYKGLMAGNQTYWTSHLPLALMLLCLTEQRAHSCVPFTVITGWSLVLLPMLTPHIGWEDFLESGKEAKVKYYMEMLTKRAMQLD